MSNRSFIEQALESGGGIVRLMPTWVPRSFCVPGRRLRLHPDDLYALGGNRGGIDERWFSSTINAENGPLTAHDEGLSYIFVSDKLKVTLAEAIAEMGVEFLGQEVIDAYGGWVMYSKFFDNMYPLPHHLHQSDEHAAVVGKLGKPEAYYYPAQYNASLGTFPYTFFGLDPDTSKEQVVECLKNFEKGDNKILALSSAQRLQLDTGWYVPPGVLHAPGTLCTYEPQRASDVFSMWQSLTGDYNIVGRDLLVANVPGDKHYDYDYLISLLDWDANVDPHFKDHYFLTPVLAKPAEEMDGYTEKWITYGTKWFSAKSLTVEPGRTVTITDPVAYGLICVQGHGIFGTHAIATPTMIRYGDMTDDEFFVTASTARAGVQITNRSLTEPLVILKHFNPGNPEMPGR